MNPPKTIKQIYPCAAFGRLRTFGCELGENAGSDPGTSAFDPKRKHNIVLSCLCIILQRRKTKIFDIQNRPNTLMAHALANSLYKVGDRLVTSTNRLKFDLGENNGTLSFEDADAFSDWLQHEKANWDWLRKISGNNKPIGQIWQHVNTQWNGIQTSVTSYQSRPQNKAELPPESIINAVQTAYGQDRLVWSDSPRGVFVIELSQSDPVVAAAALRFFIGLGIVQNDPKALEGAFRALQFQLGIKSNIDSERSALSTLRTQWEVQYTNLSEKISEITQQNEALKTTLEFDKEARANEFKDFLAASELSKTAIEQTYKEDMALKAPVEYWDTKATTHKTRAGKLGKAAVGTGIIVVVLLGVATWILLVGVDKPDYWRLAVLGLYSALGIWLVRIITRLFLSNLHQGSDAEERVTMVKTFLSLMSEGHISRDEDRQLVLQALFRSSQSGLVRDEGSPPTVIDITNKLLKNKP